MIRHGFCFTLGKFSDLCVNELVSRSGSLSSVPGWAFVTLTLRWMSLLWYISGMGRWPPFVPLMSFVRVPDAFYRADQMLLCRLWWFDKFNSLHPSPHLNPMHREKHIRHLGVGGEQFPGAGQWQASINHDHGWPCCSGKFFSLQVGKIRAYQKINSGSVRLTFPHSTFSLQVV